MKFEKITVIGLGLIGASICKALKETKSVGEIIGVDKDDHVIEYSLGENIVDSAYSKLGDYVEGSEIVLVSTYVDKIVDIVKSLYSFLDQDSIITDVGSVKGSIVKEIEETIPEHISFVGSHPIAGIEESGIIHSKSDLFINKKSVITPTENTSKSAVNKVSDFWKVLGSEVVLMDPLTHDITFGYVSHLPHIVAYSLINTIDTLDDTKDIFLYSGGGLRDFTRISASSPSMWTTRAIAA